MTKSSTQTETTQNASSNAQRQSNGPEFDAADREFATQLIRDLVATPSVSRAEGDAVDYLCEAMDGLGYTTSIDAAGNAVGVREFPDPAGSITRDVVLLGHIDTVPGNIPVRIEDGKMYGRGAVDAKGPLATFVLAAALAKPSPGTRLIVIGAVEEETSGSKGAAFVASQYQPAACVIGEPSNFDAITLGYKGQLLLGFDWQQPMAHTAGPERSIAESAVDLWNAIERYADEFNDTRSRLFDQLLPTLRHFQTSSDGLADRVKGQIGLRLPPEFDVDEMLDLVHPWAGNPVNIISCQPACQSSRSNPLAKAFARSLLRSGLKPRFKLKTGTADMNVVAPIWQCPTIAYGPGDSRLDHTPDEHLELDEFHRAIEILRQALEIF